MILTQSEVAPRFREVNLRTGFRAREDEEGILWVFEEEGEAGLDVRGEGWGFVFLEGGEEPLF